MNEHDPSVPMWFRERQVMQATRLVDGLHVRAIMGEGCTQHSDSNPEYATGVIYGTGWSRDLGQPPLPHRFGVWFDDLSLGQFGFGIYCAEELDPIVDTAPCTLRDDGAAMDQS